MKTDQTETTPDDPRLPASDCSAFEIRTLSDIFNLPTMDQMKTCLAELSDGMIQARSVKDLMGAAVEDLGGTMTVEWPVVSVWKDDGKGRIETSFTDKDGEEGAFAVVTEPNAQADPRPEPQNSTE